MAAPTATFLQYSPSRGGIFIDKTAGGVDQDETIANAALLAAFAAGTPLGDLVRTAVANDDEAAAVMSGSIVTPVVAVPSQAPQGRIYYSTQTTGVAAVPPVVLAKASAGVIVLFIETVAGAGAWTFNIDAVHSAVR